MGLCAKSAMGNSFGMPWAAEEVGFEPTVPCRTHDFQSCRIGRSRTPPRRQDATLFIRRAVERSGRVLRNGTP